MWFLLLACAGPSPCEGFVEARAACYDEAGLDDPTPENFCDDAADEGASFDTLYACYADAYETGPCTSEEEVAAAAAVASECSAEP